MTVYHQGQIPNAPTCVSCHRALDGYTGPKMRPEEGDYTLCFYCGELMRFFDAGDVLSLRPLAPAELEEFKADSKSWRKIELARRLIRLGTFGLRDRGAR